MKKLLVVPAVLALLATASLLTGAAPPEQPSIAPSDPVHTVVLASSADLEKAKKKCGVCHDGKAGYCGKAKSPAIAGLPEAKVLKSLNDPPKQMKAVAKGLSDDDKKALAKWVAAMPKCPDDKYHKD